MVVAMYVESFCYLLWICVVFVFKILMVRSHPRKIERRPDETDDGGGEKQARLDDSS